MGYKTRRIYSSRFYKRSQLFGSQPAARHKTARNFFMRHTVTPRGKGYTYRPAAAEVIYITYFTAGLYHSYRLFNGFGTAAGYYNPVNALVICFFFDLLCYIAVFIVYKIRGAVIFGGFYANLPRAYGKHS